MGHARDSTPLLAGSVQDGEPAAGVFAAERSRWWILLWYSYLSALQSLLWMTWSSVPEHSRSFLHCTDSTLDLFLNEGPIAFCCVVFFATWILKRRNGLKVSVVLGAAMCFSASLIRSIPALLSDDSRDSHNTLVLFLVHVGQIINASVAPLIVSSPSYLSVLWFPEHQRNTATAVANVANALGRAIGFFLGPAVVSSPNDLPKLLLIEIFLSLVPLVCVACYYPALPALPPSRAAVDELESISTFSDWRATLRGTLREMRAMLLSPTFSVLALAGAIEMAVYGGWSGVLPSALSPRYSDAQAGLVGSFNTFAGIAGGLVFARLSDLPRFRRRLVGIVQILSVLSAVAFAVFAYALPPLSWSAVSAMSFATLVFVCTLAGFLRGGCDPLFFELCAEAASPGPAGTAGGVLTFWYHAVLVCMLSVPAGLLQDWSPAAMAICMLVCFALTSGVRVRYVRR